MSELGKFPATTTGSHADPAPLPDGVSLVTLEHGLTLILCEDHSAPVVNAQAWCRSGSINEGRWLGGETFVSFDRAAVSLLTEQGESARLL